MGSRRTGGGVEKVYAASAKWVDRALRKDDSLFIEETPIWSSHWLAELRQLFLDQPDKGQGGFYDKLTQQLEGGLPEVYQLMGEVLYAQFLIIWKDGMRGDTKKHRVEQVLSWGASVSTIPGDLVDGLTPGIASSPSFLMLLPYQVGFIIEFVEQWKEQEAGEREQLLKDPWAFRDFVSGIGFRGRLLRDHPNTPRAQREALLHLVHPDTFEGTVSVEKKGEIAGAGAFVRFITEGTEDVDRKLEQIRRGLEAEIGGDFDFWDRDAHGVNIRAMWDQSVNTWDEFVAQGKRYVESGSLENEEIVGKREMGEDLAKARAAVLAGEPNWRELLRHALRSREGHPIAWQLLADFNAWCNEYPGQALEALRVLWEQGEILESERIRGFTSILPDSALRGGVGNSANVVSVLLMGLEVEQHPPFRASRFNRAYERTRYDKTEPGADTATVYEHALGFLDRFKEEAAGRGLELRHRLDAQSVLWQITGTSTPPPPPPSCGLTDLAARLRLTPEFLQTIWMLLQDKRQIIFQGPPGTGKTYVAQELAKRLAGDEERVTLVQLHPSYAYEDFVQGFRPTLEDGQAGFRLVDGPLLRAAKRAEAEPGENHFLLIDEINRGGIARVFGELYFLLEYRGERVHLQYQAEDAEPFSLPRNLYIIGTMNTADRSIALVDLALRRRFYFVDFHPDEEPVRGLLRRWLQDKAPDMEWVADVVERANQRLRDDRHAAIGPSYFMKEGLDDVAVARIWRHNVLPYIEELLLGQDDRFGEFDLDNLRRSGGPQSTGDSGQGLDGNGAEGTDSGGAGESSAQ